MIWFFYRTKNLINYCYDSLYMNFYIFVIFLISLFLFVTPINSWQFGGNEHETIIRDALPFLKSEILEQIVKGNHDEDDGIPDEAVGANHFDGCQFKESVDNINEKYGTLLEMSKLSFPPSKSAWLFGELLHPVQDFYSHSNWVELEKDHIIENGVGYWPIFLGWDSPSSNDLDVLIVEGDLPDGWSMTSDIIPIITSPSFEEPKKGLITHGRDDKTIGQFFGDYCPDELEFWFHDRLNKDDPNLVNEEGKYSGDITKYPDLHIKAKSLAVKQTAHEWCRLLDFINLHQGLSNVKQIFTNWVADPVSAVSSCPISDLTKSIIPDAVDTDGDGIPDASSGETQLPESGSDTTTSSNAVDTTDGDGAVDALDEATTETETTTTDDAGATQKTTKPLYPSQQYTCDPKSATLQVPAKGNKVIELQTYLTDLGYGDLLDPEKIDGKFGPHTKNSVMTYQRDFGLSVDGKVGPETWGSLCEQILSLPTTFPSDTTAAETTTDDASSAADEIQMDTNGDGAVDALDEVTTAAETTTTDDASSAADEIQMDTNGDGAVDALDEVTGTETETETTTTDDASSAADEIQMDTNGDGAVDALDEVTGTAAETTTTDDASSAADEIQMDTNGDGAVDALDEVTGTAAETTTTDDASSAADEIQMDTNGDGAVDALDEVTGTAAETTTTDDASSAADEIQMDTNGDGIPDTTSSGDDQFPASGSNTTTSLE